MQGIRAVCFDLFNTLVSVGRVSRAVGRFTADILGVDRRVWREACFGPGHDIRQAADPFRTLLKLAHSIDPGIPIDRVRQAVVERQARFDYALLNIRPEVLQSLRNIRNSGVKLGLISNASSSEVQAWADSPLAAIFDTVSFSCHCGCAKPDTPIYTHTLAGLGVRPESCLFVGDGGSDEHFGAYKVGMKPLLITHYLHTGEYPRRLEKYRAVLSGVVRDMVELEDKWFVNSKKRGFLPPW